VPTDELIFDLDLQAIADGLAGDWVIDQSGLRALLMRTDGLTFRVFLRDDGAMDFAPIAEMQRFAELLSSREFGVFRTVWCYGPDLSPAEIAERLMTEVMPAIELVWPRYQLMRARR
jgi:hypothetical protein